MKLPELNAYNNHLELFRKIFSARKFKAILEYGCGDSSAYLAAHTGELLSLEMQNAEWFEKVKAKAPKNHRLECRLGGGHFDFVREQEKGAFDLVFVDGHGDTRPECINACFEEGIKYVVTHDTEEPGYQWHKVIVPEGYATYTFKKHKEWTTLYTADHELVAELVKWENEGYPEPVEQAAKPSTAKTAGKKNAAPKKTGTKQTAKKGTAKSSGEESKLPAKKGAKKSK